MNRFDVIVTEDAKHDFKAAHDYIEFSLHNPSAADNLLDKIVEERDTLQANPFICSVIDDPFLKNYGLRFSIIGTYLLFYTVSVKNNTVTMIRFLNGRMNWRSILRQSFTIGD